MTQSKRRYNLTDCSVALALAARLHARDEAVHATAKRLYRKADASSRAILDLVRRSKRPSSVIELFLKELP